ncbi:MAG: hypothetical protein MHM6MM_002943 [Cercozoa sp. M6MM]
MSDDEWPTESEVATTEVVRAPVEVEKPPVKNYAKPVAKWRKLDFIHWLRDESFDDEAQQRVRLCRADGKLMLRFLQGDDETATERVLGHFSFASSGVAERFVRRFRALVKAQASKKRDTAKKPLTEEQGGFLSEWRKSQGLPEPDEETLSSAVERMSLETSQKEEPKPQKVPPKREPFRTRRVEAKLAPKEPSIQPPVVERRPQRSDSKHIVEWSNVPKAFIEHFIEEASAEGEEGDRRRFELLCSLFTEEFADYVTGSVIKVKTRRLFFSFDDGARARSALIRMKDVFEYDHRPEPSVALFNPLPDSKDEKILDRLEPPKRQQSTTVATRLLANAIGIGRVNKNKGSVITDRQRRIRDEQRQQRRSK